MELVPASMHQRVELCGGWKEVLAESDIFITCTTSSKGYIDRAPKPGSLQLNVSLRDYQPDFRQYVDLMLVDDWAEVCRENTDIEQMHRAAGLTQDESYSITDLICRDPLAELGRDAVIMFNPMGMAVFDIAVAAHYYHLAIACNESGALE